VHYELTVSIFQLGTLDRYAEVMEVVGGSARVVTALIEGKI
jgi:hypothetical protein